MLLVKKEGEMGREGEKEGKGGDEFKQNEKLKKWGEDGGEGGKWIEIKWENKRVGKRWEAKVAEVRGEHKLK